jgi:hypothetical protein
MADLGRRTNSRGEMLTVRFDQRTRFALEFTSRLLGQSMTTVLERALLDYAAKNTTAPNVASSKKLKWQDYWSDCEGERVLRIAELEALYPNTDDRYKVAFAREHWPFFYTSPACRECMPFYIDVLWPEIERFMMIRIEQSDTNWMAAGEAMAAKLREARIEPPEWPPKPKAASAN